MNKEQQKALEELGTEPPTEPRELVVWHALTQIGQTDPAEYWLDALGEPPDGPRQWCGIFALWCLRQAALTEWHWVVGQGFASRLHTTHDPLPGDVAYFDKPYQHHALVEKCEGDLVYLIQGNYGTPGRVARSVIHRQQKHPTFYSIAQLLPTTEATEVL